MTQDDLLRYVRKNPNHSIDEIAKATRLTFYEIHTLMTALEDKGKVGRTFFREGQAREKVVWNVSTGV